MSDLAYYKGRWIALAEDDSVAAVGETLEEARRFGVQSRPRTRLSLAWVSPYPPHVLLPEWPLQPIQPLLSGAEVWLAGGPVRDLLLGSTPHDWDFVTAGSGTALARSVADALDGGFYALDAERGTGRAVVTPPGHRKAMTLDFAEMRGLDIESDLWKRDFTINAMALTLDGRLIDPTGGQQDLQNRSLRMTTQAAFEDDPARLLRAVRLSVQLGFEIASETRARLCAEAAGINAVAPERIRQELAKLLAHPNAPTGLAQLASLGLLPYVLPEFTSGSYEREQRLPYVMALLDALYVIDAVMHGAWAGYPGNRRATAVAKTPSWAWQALARTCARYQASLLDYLNEPVSAELTRSNLLTWSALFTPPSESITPELSGDLTAMQLQALRFSGRSIAFARASVEHLARFADLVRRCSGTTGGRLADRDVYRYYRDAGEAGVATTLLGLARWLVERGATLTRSEWSRHLRVAGALFQAYFERRDEVVAPALLLTGRDLLQLGLQQGPLIGEALEALREAQAAGEVADLAQASAYVSRYAGIQSPSNEANTDGDEAS